MTKIKEKREKRKSFWKHLNRLTSFENLTFFPCFYQGGHWSGKFDFSSRSWKSQGILQLDQGNFKYQESQGKVREFHNFGPKYVL